MPDDPTVTSEIPSLSQLGPYKLESSLGAGGMGEVYRATDTRLHRTVAIKILPRDKSVDPERRRRFLQEARAASALNHPNIVTIHDISNDQGIDFLVLEHIPGVTLKQRIAEGPLGFDLLLRCASQTVAALAAAHMAGIIHRDIKPANIMITAERQIKVLDFGLAKLSAPDSSDNVELTTPGLVLGTVAYMSPEQTRGESMDVRSDIFSLGAVLYEAATGRQPWTGRSTLELMHAIATEEPAELFTLRPEVPSAFAALVARCLRKSPGERFQTMAEIAAALDRIERPGLEVVIAGRKSVAVLPFRMVTGNPEHQFLSAALADAVVNRLGATGKLLVRPTASVMRYAQAEAGWHAAAREMNVDIVVEGSIQQIGPRVRALVQAHQAADSTTLHSAKHDGDTSDLFELQDRIADAVCRALVPEAAQPAAVVAPTQNPLAYEFYMRAVSLASNMNRWDTHSAIEMLERATRLDPEFADAWARLAQACVQMGAAFDSDPRWFQQAQDAAAKALALDAANSDALCARGQIVWTPQHGYQNAVALRALNAALRVNPGCHMAQLWRGLILFHLGLHEEARRGLQVALAANPKDARTYVFIGQTALYRGDYEEAYDYHVRALAVDATSIWPNLFMPIIPLYLQRPGEAHQRLQHARQIAGDDPTLTSVEGLIEAYDGNSSKALQLAGTALQRPSSLLHTHHMWHFAAAIFALCDQPDSAIPWLTRCADMGLPNHDLFRNDPHLRPLHSRADFQQFLSRLQHERDQYRTEFAG